MKYHPVTHSLHADDGTLLASLTPAVSTQDAFAMADRDAAAFEALNDTIAERDETIADLEKELKSETDKLNVSERQAEDLETENTRLRDRIDELENEIWSLKNPDQN